LELIDKKKLPVPFLNADKVRLSPGEKKKKKRWQIPPAEVFLTSILQNGATKLRPT